MKVKCLKKTLDNISFEGEKIMTKILFLEMNYP